LIGRWKIDREVENHSEETKNHSDEARKMGKK
jgi:hypothetical protein